MKNSIDADGTFGRIYGGDRIVFGKIAARTGDLDPYSYLMLKKVYPENAGEIEFIEVTCVVGKGTKQATDPFFGLNNPIGGDCYSPSTYQAIRNMYGKYYEEKKKGTPNLLIKPKGFEVEGQKYLNVFKQGGYDFVVSTKDENKVSDTTVVFYSTSIYYQAIHQLLEAVITDNEKYPEQNALSKLLTKQKS